jgi:hypothetical protein
MDEILQEVKSAKQNQQKTVMRSLILESLNGIELNEMEESLV